MNRKNKFKFYGFTGLLLIAVAEVGIFINYKHGGHRPVALKISQWATPICWWGYILFIDALIFRLKGNSLISNRTREFLLQLPLSIFFWLIFELYNLHLKNWRYEGMPENLFERYTGMALAFATIMPGMFLTSELIDASGFFENLKINKLRITNRVIYGGIVLGFLFLMLPLLFAEEYAKYMFALVWTGFVMLFEPLVYCNGGRSLLRDLEDGRLAKIASLFVAGLVCGVLWEFWNYWAAAKWIYTAPFTQNIKIFEMPLAGFLGFAPFAWEYFVMYNFVKVLFVKTRGIGGKVGIEQ